MRHFSASTKTARKIEVRRWKRTQRQPRTVGYYEPTNDWLTGTFQFVNVGENRWEMKWHYRNFCRESNLPNLTAKYFPLTASTTDCVSAIDPTISKIIQPRILRHDCIAMGHMQGP